MTYQWYPGHMTKTMRQMKEDLKLIDLVIEIADARIPVSGRNPELGNLCGNKARIVIFGKADLADERETARWQEEFRKKGQKTIFCDFRKNSIRKQLLPLIQEATREKAERDRKRGMKPRNVRAMVCGIPNVGKSTFINSFAGTAAAKTGNRPGVTKGRQWIHMGGGVELLDTAGVLWPKFEDQKTGLALALVGSMPDDIIDRGELVVDLIRVLKKRYPGILNARYGCDESREMEAEIMADIAARRGALKKGAEPDYEKVSRLILDDFRSGRIGRITLETAGES
ncbi:MAG: ribosome biogenesis GTPase YlqF [Eubacteriales bacterium]|nr:ribosome biogenesis GTPase YlqF [Lachnospiraceae bacterium]MDD5859114.1 ribosome biogenesis GTPase YlqF [Eubacteriales bacterium]MCH4064660.1 ribosome biogenesis GTPase YlqF [Lachnospiraceae bacterium]MCH4104892.1 ribosome biogenesis GTPase YlqF [Lachnospiraceae bacterium]MCI1309724.1 ribosome biogenesis GTPase YlqF [Lachnospiraceae bacterium]